MARESRAAQLSIKKQPRGPHAAEKRVERLSLRMRSVSQRCLSASCSALTARARFRKIRCHWRCPPCLVRRYIRWCWFHLIRSGAAGFQKKLHSQKQRATFAKKNGISFSTTKCVSASERPATHAQATIGQPRLYHSKRAGSTRGRPPRPPARARRARGSPPRRPPRG